MKRTRRRKHRRSGLRIALIVIFGIVLLGGGAYEGFQGFRAWQSHRMLTRADKFLAVGDARSAGLIARSLLESDPENVGAMRMLAAASEISGQRTAIDWRQRVVAKVPRSLGDRVALARTATRFEDTAVAESALNGVPNDQPKSAEYHEIKGQLALARKERDTAETELTEAARLDPAKRSYQLQLATVQLQSGDSAKAETGRGVLRGFLEDTSLRLPATKALLEDALERRDPAIVEYADALRRYPETGFADRMVCLDLLARLKSSQFTSALTSAEEEAASDPEKLTRLLSWMSSSNLGMLALEWTKRLPAEALHKHPVFVAVADCYIAAGDCHGLSEWCRSVPWGGLEFLRHAYIARAARDCGDRPNFELEWARATKNAATPDAVETLQRAASKWTWKPESIALLWTLTESPDRQNAALRALYQYYFEEGDTGNLYRVASRLARIAPEDAVVQNSFAQLSLLLKVDLQNARSIAEKLHKENPSDAAIASTYACALWSENRAQRALEVMNRLPNDQLNRPEIAVYYAVALAKAGDKQKSRQFSEIARRGRLLPEEKSLLDSVSAD